MCIRDSQITIIRGKVEEVKLPIEKVDIIISEWMGYFLLYESMLDTVLYARDKWLATDGFILPDKAVLYVSTLEDEEYKSEKLEFWDNVYGITMPSIKRWVTTEPLVDVVNEKALNSNSCAILNIDIMKVTVKELDFAHEYQLTINRKDYVHGLVSWFDVYFTQSKIPIKLSTSPYQKSTHWKQTIFYSPNAYPVNKGDVIKGSIAVKKNKQNNRELDIKISYHLENDINKIHDVAYYRLS
eukprot:TRINITY_DN2646_c0_g1_i3.p1 TRINITY_DN2646_c0_g1~~TRINITY_DN2646_c0_g1_i3.p1  ORF type:complete len:241 (+),score=28.12 TRINITY_DN2646_c0_g1_i3:66-788(+)